LNYAKLKLGIGMEVNALYLEGRPLTIIASAFLIAFEQELKFWQDGHN